MEPIPGKVLRLKVRLRPGHASSSRFPLVRDLEVWDEETGASPIFDRIAIVAQADPKGETQGVVMVELRCLCALDLQTDKLPERR